MVIIKCLLDKLIYFHVMESLVTLLNKSYLHTLVCKFFFLSCNTDILEPILLTWINFDPSMTK